ncbi:MULTISPECIES: O-antigen ligase family protein [Paraburkholderia]|uniref:O-antigen ligase family protein n=1 Tax=Paraburkholderia madseniana TaxID=2599607 RepID=A0A6N6WEI2_9BURK|nr:MULTISPECIES: O-antigen ligase family protein [Paraburkholderia]KAE8757890.1 O-antigen ligase family protein [Paraburkholderia madseniana]MCX4173463.1 O-antigen ligase family protein [Paraburkholderia madseniana]MDQ6461468.1 O-antigen ligase family protein [Paraburkholderia madseniana]NPT62797.1 O-antigen ligase family protein [Paraburkholderia madseniana]
MTHAAARVERVFWVACPVILFVVMFGHMTAIVFNALALMALGVLAAACSPNRPSVLHWPLVLPIAGWAGWSLASVAWSMYPMVSLHAWCDEVLYPLVSFWGFWLFGTQLRRPAPVVLVNWVACVALGAISAFNWGHLQPPTANTFPLHFYNRVGHTSTLAVFAMPLFAGFMMRLRWRVIGASGIVLCLFIGLATLNRFFWPAAAVTLLIALFPLYRRRLLLSVLVIAVVGAVSVGTLEFSARLRTAGAVPAVTQARDVVIDGHQVYVPGSLSAIGDTVSADTRPKLWAFYIGEAERHAWVGVGFGKPLPGIVYRSEVPASLLTVEPQALTHAHNLFINTWLQTGVIGVVLQSTLLLCLIARFWRLRRVEPWLCAAGVALVAGMIAKNTTDDFMWQTTMLAFWAFAGLLLGCAEQVDASGGMAPETARRKSTVIGSEQRREAPTAELGE